MISKADFEPYKDLRYYGRRIGHRLSLNKKQKFEKIFPKLRIELDKSNESTKSLFRPDGRKTWLEIGFGSGENLLHQINKYHKINFIGCEPYINGLASLVCNIKEKDYDRVKLFNDDVNILLRRLPNKSVNNLFVLFPDPWPKMRHHKRRLIKPVIIEIFSRILDKGAKVFIATDDMNYMKNILISFINNKNFNWLISKPSDLFERPNILVKTRYENKALNKGIRPAYIVMEKIV